MASPDESGAERERSSAPGLADLTSGSMSDEAVEPHAGVPQDHAPRDAKALRLSWKQWPWWLMALVVLYELVGHAVIRARVPPEGDWEAAAAFVDGAWEEGDTVVVGPAWADPLLRLHLGQRLPLAHAGRSDLAPFERVWEISVGGQASPWARALREQEPALLETHGALTVRRWDLGPSPVRYDFVSHLRQASVKIGERSCRWQARGADGGGLGRGPLWPAERWHCGPQPWLFVGETVVGW